jgi:external thioesterase TEII
MAVLGDDWKVVAIDPPGHGLNYGDPLDNIKEMVDIYTELVANIPNPYLYGHSMGGLIAFLVASRMEAINLPIQAVLIGACRAPPTVVDSHWSILSDHEFFQRIRDVGGVPETFRDSPADFQKYLPSIRADFRALERFVAQPLEFDLRPISTPMWVFAAQNDRFARPETVEPWTEYGLSADFGVIKGDHFFVQNNPDPFARWLRRTFSN